MGRVTLRGWARRLFSLLAVALLFAVFLANAHAAGSASVNSMHRSASFTGHVTAPNFMPPCDPSMEPCSWPTTSPTPCPSQEADPINTVCEHFTVKCDDSVPGQCAPGTALEAGTAYACVSFPPGDDNMNDVDVYVVDQDGNIVASVTDDANPECLAFPVAPGGSYEIQINPAFIDMSNVLGFDISGSLTFTPTNPGGTATGTKSSSQLNNEMEGGGRLVDGSEFNVQVAEKELNERKLKFKSADEGPLSCAFRATSFDTVLIYSTASDGDGDPTGQAQIAGDGLNHKQPVSYNVTVTDGGRHGQGDSFSITLTDPNTGAVVCYHNGPLAKGDVDYQVSH
jgi:hypothetical protein